MYISVAVIVLCSWFLSASLLALEIKYVKLHVFKTVLIAYFTNN